MRASGQLGSADDEEFGRVPLCGSSRFYLPLGCIFRRYIRHLEAEAGSSRNNANDSRFMTRQERRAALEELLLEQTTSGASSNQQATANWRFSLRRQKKQQIALTNMKNESNDHADHVVKDPCAESAQQLSDIRDVDLEQGPVDDMAEDLASCTGPLCSICLADFDSDDAVLQSKTCSHQFHQQCILEWLERIHNTDCPCCRVAMVSEDEIWSIVKEKRKELKRQNVKLGRQHCAPKDDGDMSETEEYAGDDEDAIDALHEEATAATDVAVASASIHVQEAGV